MIARGRRALACGSAAWGLAILICGPGCEKTPTVADPGARLAERGRAAPADGASLPDAERDGRRPSFAEASEGGLQSLGEGGRPPPEEEARRILDSTGTTGGLIVHVDCGDGRLTAALGAGGRFLVHGLAADAADVKRAREHVRSLGLYGPVSVERWTTAPRLPYAENLVNLVVVSGGQDVPADELLRVLAPNGAALVLRDGRWTKTVKPWPRDIDEWTHWLHGADGNAVSDDRVVGPPRHVQWVEGPRWQRHHEMNANPTGVVSAKGRIFYISDEAPATVAGPPDRWALVARDAFNGVLLWKRPIGEWGWKTWSTRETGGRFNVPVYIARRLVAAGDRVYATLGFNAPLTALDAATGEVVRTYDGSRFTDEVVYSDGLLVLSVNTGPQKPGLAKDSPPVRKQVAVIRAETGDTLWKRGDYVGIAAKSDSFERITHLSLAVGRADKGGRVFLVEEDAVVGLDLETGRELWRSPRAEKSTRRGHVPYKPPNLCTLVAHGDVVLFAQPEEPYTRRTWNRGCKVRLSGISAATGKELWSCEASKWGPGVKADVFAIRSGEDDLVWTHAADGHAVIGVDIRSGEVKRRFSTGSVFSETHHHRCYRNKATTRYLLTARRGIEFIDLKTEECEKHHWVRGACRYGIIPCNGLVYALPHPCKCYIDVKLSGFYALAPAREAPPAERKTPDSSRLERGPAWNTTGSAPAAAAASPDDWPTYRHDVTRSGSTRTEVPAELEVLWRSELGETGVTRRASACTAAGGRVFAASVDEHRVCALSARDGRRLWSFTAGGRVDTPPTVCGNLVLFGSADGRVYALRASDGALAWRFRAAPEERRVVAFGRLESAWPVHGSVLVKDGVAYAAAGRSTYLDGGIRVCALRPRTGELVRELETLNKKPHGLEDVLVSDGRTIYMRHLRFGLEGDAPAAKPDPGGAGGRRSARRGRSNEPPASGPRAFSTAGLLDNSYFSRTGWSTGGRGGGKSGGAHLLVFDGRSTYTFRSRRKGGFGGWFRAGAGAYELAAVDRKTGKPRWSTTIPVRVRAMAVAGETLFVAGPPDVAEPDDPWAAFEGRKGGVLRAVSAADGKTLREYRLDSPPVFDGLIASGGRLYVSTRDGRVVCMGRAASGPAGEGTRRGEED